MVHRREVLLAGAGLMVAASAAEAAAPAAPAQGSSFASALAGCVEAGNVCLQHCLVELGQGDKSLGACAVAVRDMLAVCNSTAVLVAGNAPRLKAAVALCRDVCADCEKACRVHQDHHPECKACAEACARVVAESGKLLA